MEKPASADVDFRFDPISAEDLPGPGRTHARFRALGVSHAMTGEAGRSQSRSYRRERVGCFARDACAPVDVRLMVGPAQKQNSGAGRWGVRRTTPEMSV